jgi:tetratricopeptide (TPR) repeat protein
MREGDQTSERSKDSVVEAIRNELQEPIERSAVFEPAQIINAVFEDLAELSNRAFENRFPNLKTSGASEAGIRSLLDAGESLLDRKPARAEQIYSLAAELVASLPDTPAPLAHSLHGLAEKGRANALRMTGRYTDALSALVDSERAFEAVRYCKRELGYARYCRATVLFKMEQWVDAYRAVHAARGVLEAERDRAGVLNCDILKACITLEWGELDRAREMFLALRKTVEARHDYRRLADLWMNLVICDLRRGDTAGAALWLGRAVRKFRELGLASEVTRGRWCAATIALAQGQRARAVDELKAAAAEFEALGMPVDAAFVKLELLGVLVEDKKWREAQPIALSAANLFLTAGVRPSAAKALEYLREAVKSRSADREAVTRVTRFIRRAEVFPDEAFRAIAEGPA